jgi:hypothetical protein
MIGKLGLGLGQRFISEGLRLTYLGRRAPPSSVCGCWEARVSNLLNELEECAFGGY